MGEASSVKGVRLFDSSEVRSFPNSRTPELPNARTHSHVGDDVAPAHGRPRQNEALGRGRGMVAELLRRTWAMTWKDVTVELRARERINAMLFFAALVLFIFNFALGPAREKRREGAPGLLWLAFLFTGMLGLGRSFQAERENEGFEELLLTPGDREAIFFGKLAGNILFMVTAEALILPLFGILYNLDIWGLLPSLALVAFLGTVGFSAIGTLLAAMTAHLRAREVMLPVLLFPLT